MFYYTKDFAYGGLMDFGTGFWPRIIAAIMMICAAALFVTTLINNDPKMKEVVIDWTSQGMKSVIAVVAVVVVFCVLLYFIGLCFALVFMIAGIMLCMQERRIPVLAAVALGMPLFIYVVFQILLKVKLPTGVLFK